MVYTQKSVPLGTLFLCYSAKISDLCSGTILDEPIGMDNKAERKKFLGSLVIPLIIVTIMWVVKTIEWSFGIYLGRFGITPHTARGLIGIFTLPFLHGNWEHLLSNTIPIIVLGTALYYCYPSLANRVMLITYLGSGLLTWCIGDPSTTHIGASALVYGLNLFLITSGFIRGNRMLIVISLIMVFLYGSFIWGMIPSLAIPQNISWEGHLSGALIGILLAIFLRKEGPQKEVYHWEEDDEEDDDSNGSASNDSTDATSEKPYWDVPTPSNDELTVRYRFRH
ncbi:MAG: rhomboid family protein [bacterium F082]|nr:MAG: rhomboid family protein [bacterium F082]KWW31510.1 MAG: rhomboid family protein [bacterium P201]